MNNNSNKQKYLFLDFDGVLNSIVFFKHSGNNSCIDTEAIDPVAVEILNSIVKALDAKVVISSTWRINYTLERLIQLLEKQGFCGQVVGATPARLSHRERGFDIQEWMDHHKVLPEDIVILDDNSDMEHLKNRLIQTTYEKGLRSCHLEKALKLFNN